MFGDATQSTYHSVQAPPGPAHNDVAVDHGPAPAMLWPNVRHAAEAPAPVADRRRARRISLPASQRWYGQLVGKNRERVVVHDFCATGLKVVIRSHAALLPLGAQTVVRLQVPEVEGTIVLPASVRRVQAGSDRFGPVATYGLWLRTPTARAQAQWSRALLRHATYAGLNATPTQLQKEGFAVRAAARALNFATLRSQAQLRQIMQLRYDCYREMRLLPPGADTVADMTDSYDGRSFVVGAWLGDQALATARAFAPAAGDKLTLDEWLPSRQGLPPLDVVVEFSRVAIARDYRGCDLLPTLCQYVARYALARKRRYLLLGTNAHLARYYQRYGARTTALTGSYCGALAQAMLVDLVRVWREGTAEERNAMFGTPPPLDNAAVRMPKWRPRWLKKTR